MKVFTIYIQCPNTLRKELYQVYVAVMVDDKHWIAYTKAVDHFPAEEDIKDVSMHGVPLTPSKAKSIFTTISLIYQL
jgi:hypothetical protein